MKSNIFNHKSNQSQIVLTSQNYLFGICLVIWGRHAASTCKRVVNDEMSCRKVHPIYCKHGFYPANYT